MRIDVHMLDRTTGERVIYRDDYEWAFNDADTIDYMWGEGNYSCDCNRAKFFAWAKGMESEDVDCGHSRYAVEKIVERETGGTLYEGDDDLEG